MAKEPTRNRTSWKQVLTMVNTVKEMWEGMGTKPGQIFLWPLGYLHGKGILRFLHSISGNPLVRKWAKTLKQQPMELYF